MCENIYTVLYIRIFFHIKTANHCFYKLIAVTSRSSSHLISVFIFFFFFFLNHVCAPMPPDKQQGQFLLWTIDMKMVYSYLAAHFVIIVKRSSLLRGFDSIWFCYQ
jgi:hypothetical protein